LRLKWEDHLSPGVQGQPGNINETPQNKREKHLIDINRKIDLYVSLLLAQRTKAGRDAKNVAGV
jgi:hypothetical protein